MKTREDIELLEKTIGQLRAIHREISVLSKKSPSDAVNLFKLRMINGIIEAANHVLGQAYAPIRGFEQFEEDDIPSTSDVVFVLAQYMEEIERFRKDNVVIENFKEVYVLDGSPSELLADPQRRGVK